MHDPRDASDTNNHRQVQQILDDARIIAVVGLSADPDRDSHRVARYMQEQGYRIIPVNPTVEEVLGEKSYARLADVPETVDIVNVFRRPDAVPGIVDDAIAVKAGTVWLQYGLVDEQAADKARRHGLQVVMDKCIMVEHRATHSGW